MCLSMGEKVNYSKSRTTDLNIKRYEYLKVLILSTIDTGWPLFILTVALTKRLIG